MSSITKKFNNLPSSLNEEVMVSKKQGIVSILGSDCERTKSLRRTLSADMSSKKWLSQNGFSSCLKRIASSQEFPVSIIADPSSSEGEDENEKETETQGHFEIWSSILTQKAQEETQNLPPYIHPLVKRAVSSLSEKSLEICTEGLGSETGSDGFSSYPPSETGDAEEDKEEEQEEEDEVAQNYDVEDCRIGKYNVAASAKKSIPKPFPPPLASLPSCDRASLHMRPRRDNGRFVLEAVSVSSQNNFKAQRQDGRLVLSFINSPNQEEEGIKRAEKNEMEMFEVETENSENEEEAEEEGKETEEEEEVDERGGGGAGGGEEVRFVMEQTPKLPSGVINVHKFALFMNKPMVLANSNPTWSNKINEMVKFEQEMEEVVNPITPMMHALPPAPRMIPMPPVTTAKAAVAAASFNAYEYYWKPKSMATTTATTVAAVAEFPSPITQKPPLIRSKDNSNKSILSKNLMANEKRQEWLILRGNKGDCLVPLSKGCKEPRRSLLFWEPYCIATS